MEKAPIDPIATTRSKQYCPTCKKETMHTPKLGLAVNNKRLCEVCRTVNEVTNEQTDSIRVVI
jgi:CRISPR/Cas system-associated protein Cas10 (large subunit of type III CRISPR-Cas system)